MAAYVSAGKVGDFEPGEMKVVSVEGKDVAVTLYEGAFYAFRNECTHQGVALAGAFGELNGRRIVCALHDSSFDIKNGRVNGGPATERLETFTVRVEGDEVLVGRDE